jgi:ABC-type uncharacterized transport system permease subunit
MMIKGIKPRTHLIIDLLLFALLLTAIISAFLEHTVPSREIHIRFMLHVFHGVAGIALCLTVALHLFLHLPWIESQLRRLFSELIENE